jgi:hypothetical protein
MIVARQFIAWYSRENRNRLVGHGMIGSDLRDSNPAPQELNLYSDWFQIRGWLHRSGISGPILAHRLDVAPTEVPATFCRGAMRISLLLSIAVGAKRSGPGLSTYESHVKPRLRRHSTA